MVGGGAGAAIVTVVSTVRRRPIVAVRLLLLLMMMMMMGWLLTLLCRVAPCRWRLLLLLHPVVHCEPAVITYTLSHCDMRYAQTSLTYNRLWMGTAVYTVKLFITKQYGGLKSGVSRARNSTISQPFCAGALFCWKLQSTAKVKLSPQMRWNDCFRRILW